MKFFALPIILFLITACSTPYQPTPITKKLHYKILFQDKMVGRLIHEESITDDLIRNTEILELKTQFRGMDSITSQIIETHEESLEGEMLRYRKHYTTPNAERQFLGEVVNNQWRWQITQGEQQKVIDVDLPADFFLHHALQKQMKIQLRKNKSFTYSGWNENLHLFEKIRLDIIESNPKQNRWKISQSYPHAKQASRTYWVNKDFQLLESRIRYGDYLLSVLPCDENCQTTSLTAIRPLDHQMLPSPYRITHDALQGHIRYQLSTESPILVPATTEQKVKPIPNGWQIDVCANCVFPDTEATADISLFLQDNIWLDIHNESLIKAVNRAVNDKMSTDEKMKKLVKITRDRLNDLQFQGYATASQAYKSGRGDCTEYALLLASFGRIAKIPTRVLLGLSYSRESFHGKRDMYAPHAWVQAWVDGQWKSYDAGMEYFDAGHIALKISDGDKQDFGEMVKQLEGLKIISSQQVIKRKK